VRILSWEQFSSNHSSSYTVVGEFQSPEAAHAASERIRGILEEVIAWCFAHYDDCHYSTIMSPVEHQYGDHYGFDWKERIDWLTYGLYDAVTPIDRLVVIDPSHADTWQTGHQFVHLLAAMGANVAREVMGGQEPDIDHEVWTSMSIEISADTSAEDALSLQTELRQYTKSRESFHSAYPIPWLRYHPRLQQHTVDEIRKLEAEYLTDEAQTWPLHKEYGSDNEGFHRAWAEVRTLAHEQWVFIGRCRRNMEISRFSVNQTHQGVEIGDIRFAEITIGFPAFLTYLREKGCANIRYTVNQYHTL
jgi:hypothetical protein